MCLKTSDGIEEIVSRDNRLRNSERTVFEACMVPSRCGIVTSAGWKKNITIIAMIFFMSLFSGCSLWDRSFEVRIYKPFYISNFREFTTFVCSDSDGVKDYDNLADQYIQKNYSLENTYEHTAMAKSSKTLLLRFQGEDGLIFPPLFHHNILEPIFISTKKINVMIFNHDQTECYAEIIFRRGLFREELYFWNLNKAFRLIFDSKGNLGVFHPKELTLEEYYEEENAKALEK